MINICLDEPNCLRRDMSESAQLTNYGTSEKLCRPEV